VLELQFPVEGTRLQTLYAGADAVLANSGFEPFGLVGLEAMASRGLVLTGSTGEDYIAPFRNGFALETDDPCEIVQCLAWLDREPGRDDSLRRAGYETAHHFRWTDVIDRLTVALGVDDPS
jgi:glycosyltransferase involved in cell wall biosynthesis